MLLVKLFLLMKAEVFRLLVSGKTFDISIEGDRDSLRANAMMMLPDLLEKIGRQLGSFKLDLGEPRDGRLPEVAWLLLVEKGDQELEGARQRALKVMDELKIELVQPDRYERRQVSLASLDLSGLGEVKKEKKKSSSSPFS